MNESNRFSDIINTAQNTFHSELSTKFFPERTINKGGTTKTLGGITSPRHPAQISLP